VHQHHSTDLQGQRIHSLVRREEDALWKAPSPPPYQLGDNGDEVQEDHHDSTTVCAEWVTLGDNRQFCPILIQEHCACVSDTTSQLLGSQYSDMKSCATKAAAQGNVNFFIFGQSGRTTGGVCKKQDIPNVFLTCEERECCPPQKAGRKNQIRFLCDARHRALRFPTRLQRMPSSTRRS
jgi:hypothetical protein